jgi:ribonuclease BN (tRNA processing enzyme)
MRLTIIGSGDAFGSGGRFNTCFLLETAKGTLLVDCGASSLVALKARGRDVLKPRLPDLHARRIMLTHMNPVMLAHLDEVRAAGALVAEDGAVIEL